MTTRGRGQRAGLSRDTVLDAARAVLTESPGRELSWRAVARRLDVAPNALYTYVSNRDALVEALLDDALADVGAVVATTTPRAEVLEIMTRTYDALLTQPAVVPLHLSHQGSRGPHAVALGDRMQVALRTAGLTETTARHLVQALVVTVIGYAAYDLQSTEPRRSRTTFRRAAGWLVDGALASGSRPRVSPSRG